MWACVCVSVCLRVSLGKRRESTDGLLDTCVSASGCGNIKCNVSAGGCSETLYGSSRSRSNRLSLLLPSGAVKKEHSVWLLQVYQRGTLDLCFWHGSERNTTLVCYCSSYLLLLIACGHRLFFLAQPTPCCLSAQLLSFKCPNVCLAQKHQGRLFISKTKDAVWVASARAEASMPPTSLHICSRNALLFVLLSHCSLNSIRKHFDPTHKVHWEQTQLKTSATFSIQSFT